MQFKITFKVLHPGQLLPLSYQYELSSWLYGLIGRADREFGDFLHSKGYVEKGKRFKLFTFSNLYIPPKFNIIDDRIKIWSSEISMMVSFLVDKPAMQMILALFDEQPFRLGDRISQVELRVQSVSNISMDVPEQKVYRLATIAPMVVTAPDVLPNGKIRHRYLSPQDADFEHYFFQNLLRKYKVARKYDLVQDVDLEASMHFRLASEKVKKQGVRIKAQTKQETKVIGYQFDFEVDMPRGLVELGVLAGWGSSNAMGFGASRVVTKYR